MYSDSTSTTLKKILHSIKNVWDNQDILDSSENREVLIQSIVQYSKFLQNIDIDVVFDKRFDWETQEKIDELTHQLNLVKERNKELEISMTANRALLDDIRSKLNLKDIYDTDRFLKSQQQELVQCQEEKRELEQRLARTLFGR